MARIVLADDGITFDGLTLATRPLGGAETAVIGLMEELARRGHEALVRNTCAEAGVVNGVDWAPIHAAGPYRGLPDEADLYIANRGDRLIPLLPRARARAFWIHNPARYLLKWRYLSKLWRYRPTIVFIGAYHLTTCPDWVPDGGRVVIPYGISAWVRAAAREMDAAPPPRAVFTSSPLRSLDWLLDLWADRIRPRVPEAELHLFSGAATYGAVGRAKADAMEAVLTRARGLTDSGVIVHDPLPERRLVEELRGARVMLYRGAPDETFCLAVGEAQALGVPAVVQRHGAVAERVVDGETGFIAAADDGFVDVALRLLTDDVLWRRQHRAALANQGRRGWPEAAAAFERLIP